MGLDYTLTPILEYGTTFAFR